MTEMLPPPVLPAAPALPTLPAPLARVQAPTPAEGFDGVVRPVAAAPVNPVIELPSGLKVRRDLGPVRPTALLGATMIATYVAVAAGCIVFAWHFTEGKRRTDQWFAQGFANPSEAAWAVAFDHRSLQIGVVLGALTLVATVATAAWSRRIATNTRSIGSRSANPGWATICWFLPFMWFWAGFAQLRRAPRASWPVWAWQIAFTVPFVASWAATRAGQFRNVSNTAEGIPRRVNIQADIRDEWLVTLFFAGFMTLAAILAARAVLVLARTFREIATVAPPA